MSEKKVRAAKGKWSAEDLQNAMKAIEEGFSIRQAAKRYGIPYSTVQERLKKGLPISASLMGHKPVFTPEQERAMAEKIKWLAKVFYGITPGQLRTVAYQYAEENNIPHNFNHEKKSAGPDWLRNFLKRNSDVSVRTPEATSLNRVTAMNRNDVNVFFDNLEALMVEYNFSPERIWNMDETGVTTVQEPGVILAPKGEKRVGSITSGERGSTITVVCAVSATGNYIPPMFIYPRQRIAQGLSAGGPAGAIYHCSKNGWTNSELFCTWLRHFVRFAKTTPKEPALLILDNHVSHISLDAYNYCRDNGIVMLSLPPHTSHRLQPLDVSFFGPLKRAYRLKCDSFMKEKALKRVTHHDIASIFNSAFLSVASVQKGVSGFSSTGICPFNRNVFTDDDFMASDSLLNAKLTPSIISPTFDNIVPVNSGIMKSVVSENLDATVDIETAPIVFFNEDNLTFEMEPEVSLSDELVTVSGVTVDFQTLVQSENKPPNTLADTSSGNSIIFKNIETALNLTTKKGGRVKQKSTILTSSPMKEKLEDIEKKRRAREEKAAERTEKRTKNAKEEPEPKMKKQPVRNAKNKERIKRQ